MAEQRLDRTLEASVDVAAEPADVWRIVGDIRRTGEWSPECSRALPLGHVFPTTVDALALFAQRLFAILQLPGMCFDLGPSRFHRRKDR